MAESSPVFMFERDDAEMDQASQAARMTFRYFWRELSWEQRRIVPGLDMACGKAPFSDAGAKPAKDRPNAEHMWLKDIDFDGALVTGTLINKPNWLKSVKAGQQVCKPLPEIADWMYAIRGEVYGAFTVNLLRSRMNHAERKNHDAAWGLNFGDPGKIRIVPDWNKAKPGGSAGLPEDEEHPMSENMGPSLRAQLKKDRSLMEQKDARGWTLLHHLALGGSAAGVKVLLEEGAQVNARTKDGRTALQFADALGWDRVVELLRSKGAR